MNHVTRASRRQILKKRVISEYRTIDVRTEEVPSLAPDCTSSVLSSIVGYSDFSFF